MDLLRCSRPEKKRAKFLRSSSSTTCFLLDSEGLLIEILSRLPCRSAVRLKLVCKRWCSLISSPFFLTFFNHRRHHHHHHDPPPDSSSYTLLIQLIYRDGSTPVVIDYDRALVVLPSRSGSTHPVAVPKWLNFSFLPRGNKLRIAIRASCDDLFLCSFSQVLTPDSLYTEYYVCNLQTRQWVSLPPIVHPRDHCSFGLLCVPSPCSLCHNRQGGGVDNSRCDFIAMRIPCPFIYKPHHTQIDVEIFSSKEGGQWKKYVVSSPVALSHGRLMHTGMVPFKGMLHWLNYPHIVVFDPCNAPVKISRIIDVQIGIRSTPFIDSFGICCGRLRIVHSTLGEVPIHQCIWELEDYDTGKWSLVRKFILHGKSWPSHVHLDGNAIYGISDTSLWISNIQTGGIDQKYELITRGLRYCGNRPCVNTYAITDQGWPTPVPSLLS